MLFRSFDVKFLEGFCLTLLWLPLWALARLVLFGFAVVEVLGSGHGYSKP